MHHLLLKCMSVTTCQCKERTMLESWPLKEPLNKIISKVVIQTSSEDYKMSFVK